MSTDVSEIEKSKIKVGKPKKWAVILHNDDVTPMDYVVTLLVHVFKKSSDEAMELMLRVHEHGKGVAGVYTYEIAEQKYNETMAMNIMYNQALKVTLQEE